MRDRRTLCGMQMATSVIPCLSPVVLSPREGSAEQVRRRPADSGATNTYRVAFSRNWANPCAGQGRTADPGS